MISIFTFLLFAMLEKSNIVAQEGSMPKETCKIFQYDLQHGFLTDPKIDIKKLTANKDTLEGLKRFITSEERCSTVADIRIFEITYNNKPVGIIPITYTEIIKFQVSANSTIEKPKDRVTKLAICFDAVSIAVAADTNFRNSLRLNISGTLAGESLAKGIVVDDKSCCHVIYNFSENTRQCCKPGFVEDGENNCICPPGTSYNVTSRKCKLCPKNTYQALKGQLNCIKCEADTITRTSGSTGLKDCVESCSQGSFYSSNRSACKLCPQNFFQSLEGQFKCTPCQSGKVTVSNGAKLEEDCISKPSRPRNVTVIPEGITLNVSWMPPKYLNGKLRHYILLSSKTDENFGTSVNVSTTSFLLDELEELTNYSIKVFAVNNFGVGNSSSVVTAQTERLPRQAPKASHNWTNIGAIVGGLIGAILFITLFIIFLRAQKRKRIKNREKSVELFHAARLRNNPNSDAEILVDSKPAVMLEEISYIRLLKDWEIAPDKLQLLDKKLGEGKFGIVKQGLLTSGKGDPELVAVKMLKDGAKESDLQDLMTELTILKEVNKIPHPNVIRFIGGCSIEGKLHVITELCSGGNLRSLLINSRVYPSEENLSNYINLSSTLNHRQLVKIAADIANGMVHLSSQKFVHRDLAARNILISEDNMAKVSDFGLARDVEGAEEYIRKNQDLLPVKWMALESLLHDRFTVASDVWSYGVLLHEIVTLGEEPYKGISSYNIVNHVGTGCRMSQPPQCSDEIYEIMTNCWKVELSERPTFKDIHATLQNMLIDNEKAYINIAHVMDEGSFASTSETKKICRLEIDQ